MTFNIEVNSVDRIVLIVIAILLVAAVRIIWGFFHEKK